EFRGFPEMALAKERGLFRVEAGGDIFRDHLLNMITERFCIGVSGERMEVGHHEVTFEFFLHAHIIPHRTEVIPKVQISSRPDTAQYYFPLCSHIDIRNAKVIN